MSKKRVRAHVNPLSIQTEHATFSGFENTNAIFVDVGAYKGEFVEQLSQKFPDHNFICFEIRKPIAQALSQKFAGQKNFKVFDGDAGRNFRAILEPSIKRGIMIEKIFINFPDPWFKEKHKKRRFLNAKFLKSLSDWMPSSVKFIFQTDQKILFLETLQLLKESDFNHIQFFESSAYGIPTDWERAKIEAGECIYRMEFSKQTEKTPKN